MDEKKVIGRVNNPCYWNNMLRNFVDVKYLKKKKKRLKDYKQYLLISFPNHTLIFFGTFTIKDESSMIKFIEMI